MNIVMTPVMKITLAGLGVLAVGSAVGYGAGVMKDRNEYKEQYMERSGRNGQGIGMMNGSGKEWVNSRGRGGSGDPRMGDAGKGTRGNGGGMNRGDCLSDGCLAVDGLDYPAGDLSDAAKSALASALDDEYKALATYEAVMAKFGGVRPFIMIARAEEQHISALKSVYDKYGLTIPANPYTGTVAAPETQESACQTGVDAEIANASLYRDTLLPAVKDYPDITAVFTSLMNASQQRHLPAFDRCN